jgi:glycosyltransferase involved in cell wall biosynthesis
MRVIAGLMFFPRGGSAYVAHALARGLDADVTLVAGSTTEQDARAFYAGVDVRPVDYSAGDAPMHGSYEDRPDAPDRIFAALDDEAYARHVEAWAAALDAAGAARADVLHLHHLTPINAAAELAAPGVPIVGHLHGTELLMLEAIAAGGSWPYAAAWAGRLRTWATACERLIVAPGNARRAVKLLGVDERRLVRLPNGFDPSQFHPLDVDRRAVWHRVLVDEPRGWRPGEGAGSVRYAAADVDELTGGPIVLSVSRFTAVKRLGLLLEAFADARARMATPASLILVGGRPGEWEGEHPADVIDRLGATWARLAGWCGQAELPELLAAADLLVLASNRESFGQVIVEAMACGVPPVAAASPGPARIVDDGVTGWLVPVDDRDALADALVDAVDRPRERAARAAAAVEAARERFTWPAIANDLLRVLQDAQRDRPSGALSHRRTVS